MKRSQLSLSLSFIVLLCLTSCVKEPVSDDPGKEADVDAPPGFNYSTTKLVDVSVRLLSNQDQPLQGIPITLKSTSSEVLFQGFSESDGSFTATLSIPASTDTLIIEQGSVGLLNEILTLVQGGKVNCVIGGRQGLSGDFAIPSPLFDREALKNERSSVLAGTTYSYMGTYNESGRPVDYLEPEPTSVSPALLSYINASLPQGKDVRGHHPQYIDGAATQNLNLLSNSDVYISFVAEDARNLNSVGFYTYPTNRPPKSIDEISNIKLIFPNASAYGAGGGMISGDRIKIGTFSAGTSVGFVLFRNAWRNDTKQVNTRATKFFTHNSLNPENDDFLKIHSVLLEYKPERFFVIGFEDSRRDQTSDHDFNDVLLLASSVPTTAISEVDVRELDVPGDRDGDGISDAYDLFPDDRTKAYVTYFPSPFKFGTLVFEDNWPASGDYDLNDLVIKYRYKMIANAGNKVVEMDAEFAPIAVGASFYNGFGVEFPFSASRVERVTGYKFLKNYITLNSNGVEAGQDKAVIIPFDNHEAFLRYNNGAFFINTGRASTGDKLIADTAKINIKLKKPLPFSMIGQAPFNPFLISNMRRGYEVHLPGYTPTRKASSNLFGTLDDASNLAEGRYYLTKSNAPWAMNFLDEFSYPKEEVDVRTAYHFFNEWALSGGLIYKDWYNNTSAAYRDVSKLYNRN